MALNDPAGTQPECQSNCEAHDGYDKLPAGNPILNRAIEPVDRRRDHQSAGEDQPRAQNALANAAAPRANWPIGEDKSDQRNIDEVD